MKIALAFWILLVIAFLVSAKTHGRQHRLERELAGHWSVSFTTQNHPWIESFWFRQRVVYWSLAAVAAFLMATRKWGNVYLRIPISIIGSMILAFIVTGLMSVTRFAMKVGGNANVPGKEWLSDAIWGSAGFWLLTIVSVFLLILVARKWKPAGATTILL